MSMDSKGKYETQRDSNIYRDLINAIEKLTARIDDLYGKVKEQGVVITERKKEKITNFERKINNEEINSLKIIIKYKEEIIKILEGLLKTPFLILVKNALKSFLLFLAAPFVFVYSGIKNAVNNISNFLKEIKEKRNVRALQKQREREERKRQKQKEKEDLALQKRREKEAREEQALRKLKEKEEQKQQKQKEIEDLALQKRKEKEAREEQAIQKQREEEELKRQKQKEKEEKEALALRMEREKEEKRLQEEREKEESALQKEREKLQEESDRRELAQQQEKKEELSAQTEEGKKEETAAFNIPYAAYYSPKDTSADKEKIQAIPVEQTKKDDKKSYLRYIIPLLILLLAGFLIFIAWNLFDTSKEAAIELEEKTEAKIAAGLLNCLSGKPGTVDPVESANEELNDASYCCFNNRVTAIDPDQFDKWKDINLNLIKCVSDNLPGDYILAVIGHANRTGYEENLKYFWNEEMEPRLVIGNYTYSTERAKSLLEKLGSSVNSEKILYYGMGSSNPLTASGIDPMDAINRRVTFKIMKKEESNIERDEWLNKKEQVKVIKSQD